MAATAEISVSTETLGEAWLEIARRILPWAPRVGTTTSPSVRCRACDHCRRPQTDDPIVNEFGDPERIAWMHANFTDRALVRELGDARSYASRLFDYAGSGRDQVAWVIERLRNDPTSRSATITTFEPLLDTSYIPCVSLLDFWIRDGALEQVVYAHSIDFGSKGYGNLSELAWLQEHIASELSLPLGRLDFLIKSAHIYDSDLEYMNTVLAQVAAVG